MNVYLLGLLFKGCDHLVDDSMLAFYFSTSKIQMYFHCLLAPNTPVESQLLVVLLFLWRCLIFRFWQLAFFFFLTMIHPDVWLFCFFYFGFHFDVLVEILKSVGWCILSVWEQIMLPPLLQMLFWDLNYILNQYLKDCYSPLVLFLHFMFFPPFLAIILRYLLLFPNQQ